MAKDTRLVMKSSYILRDRPDTPGDIQQADREHAKNGDRP